jgi:hypothetical protein
MGGGEPGRAATSDHHVHAFDPSIVPAIIVGLVADRHQKTPS